MFKMLPFWRVDIDHSPVRVRRKTYFYKQERRRTTHNLNDDRGSEAAPVRRSTFMEMVIPVRMEQAMKLFAKLKEMKAAVSAQVASCCVYNKPKKLCSLW